MVLGLFVLWCASRELLIHLIVSKDATPRELVDQFKKNSKVVFFLWSAGVEDAGKGFFYVAKDLF